MSQNNIMIVGCSGSGKSTLARQLSQALGLRIIHMDHFYSSPGWKPRTQAEINELLSEALATEGWICEGNNSASFPLRVPKAHLLIWMDLPWRVCFWRVIKRMLCNYGKERPDLPAGCPDRFNWTYVKWVWNFNKNSRPKLEKLYQETEGQLERVHLRTQEEVSLLLAASWNLLKIHRKPRSES